MSQAALLKAINTLKASLVQKKAPARRKPIKRATPKKKLPRKRNPMPSVREVASAHRASANDSKSHRYYIVAGIKDSEAEAKKFANAFATKHAVTVRILKGK